MDATEIEAIDRYVARFGMMPPLFIMPRDPDLIVTFIDQAIAVGREIALEDIPNYLPDDAILKNRETATRRASRGVLLACCGRELRSRPMVAKVAPGGVRRDP